jgi:hypothetical protein
MPFGGAGSLPHVSATRPQFNDNIRQAVHFLQRVRSRAESTSPKQRDTSQVNQIRKQRNMSISEIGSLMQFEFHQIGYLFGC